MGSSWGHANGVARDGWVPTFRDLLSWHLAGAMQMGQPGTEGA